jgi:hypothetical protein
MRVHYTVTESNNTSRPFAVNECRDNRVVRLAGLYATYHGARLIAAALNLDHARR